MPHCVAYKCSNQSNFNTNVSYHLLPKNKTIYIVNENIGRVKFRRRFFRYIFELLTSFPGLLISGLGLPLVPHEKGKKPWVRGYQNIPVSLISALFLDIYGNFTLFFFDEDKS